MWTKYEDPLQFVCDIIQKEMDLGESNVWIYNEKRDIPKNKKGVYVVVGEEDAQVATNFKNYISDTGLTEQQTVLTMARISVDIFSYDDSARLRKAEVLMALKSDYSENMQQANCISIRSLPASVLNASGAEGPKIINRFNIVFKLFYRQDKQKAVNYYNQFPQEVMINQ